MKSDIGSTIFAILGVFGFCFVVIFIVMLFMDAEMALNPWFYVTCLFFGAFLWMLTMFCTNCSRYKKNRKFSKIEPVDFEGFKSANSDSLQASRDYADVTGQVLFDEFGQCCVVTEPDAFGATETIPLKLPGSVIIPRHFTDSLAEIGTETQNDEASFRKKFTPGQHVYVFGELCYDGSKYSFAKSLVSGFPLWISADPREITLPAIKKFYRQGTKSLLYGFLTLVMIFLTIYFMSLIVYGD